MIRPPPRSTLFPSTTLFRSTINAPPIVISQNGWTLKYVDSQATGGCGNYPATNSFDGYIGSIYHSQTVTTVSPMPHSTQIDMGTSYSLTGFHYLPRQDGGTN